MPAPAPESNSNSVYLCVFSVALCVTILHKLRSMPISNPLISAKPRNRPMAE
jgi:hypothetical protein